MRVNDVDGFIKVIRSLHEKYDNAEEIAKDIELAPSSIRDKSIVAKPSSAC